MKTGNIFNSKLLPVLTIWILASGIASYFRLYPLRTYVSGNANEKASILVVNSLRKKIQTTINHMYPLLPPIKRKQLAQKEFEKVFRNESKNIKESIEATGRKIDKESPPKNKIPYLLGSDSYNYYDLTKNIIATGTMSRVIKGSKYLNEKGAAPIGKWEPLNFHPYVGFFIYKIVSWLKPGLPLTFSLSLTPVIIAILSLLPFILICRLLRCSFPVIFTASLYLVLAPVFLRRSMFGWYDNDPYNIFFPLYFLLVLFGGLKKGKPPLFYILLGILCSSIISLYTLFWQGWVFHFSVILIALIIIVIYSRFVLKEPGLSKNILFLFLSAVFAMLLGISIIFGFTEFFVLFKEGWQAFLAFANPSIGPWPDLYIAVGELKPTSLNGIFGLTGGPVLFTLSLLGLSASIIKAFRRPGAEHFPVFVLAVFYVVSLISTLKAERFALLCVIPFSLFFALGLKTLLNLINSGKLIFENLPERRLNLITKSISILIFTVLILSTLNNAYKRTPDLLNKIFNDTWNSVLTKIKGTTPPNSIVNTWWSPGHFIKSVAERRVTFDGASINVPQAYWLARVLLNDNEDKAMGILRMLNTSANEASDYLTSIGFRTSEAVDLLLDITALKYSDAKNKLASDARLTPEQSAKILSYTHNPHVPPSYMLIYNDLVEKNMLLKFIANWDFKKVDEINDDPELRKELLAGGVKAYVRFGWKIAGGQPHYSGLLAMIGRSEDKILFQKGVQLDISRMRCKVNSPNLFGKGVPYSIFYMEDGKIIEKKFSAANLTFSVILIKKDNTYECVLLDRELAKSVFARLSFFNGAGLKYFSPFINDADFTGRTSIEVYKVHWDKFLRIAGSSPE